MIPQESITDRLNSGLPLVLDGATGTLLLAKGYKPPFEALIVADPAPLVERLRDFANVADSIQTPTFGATRERYGLHNLYATPEFITAMNQMALRMTQEAASKADHPVYVAADYGPLGQILEPEGGTLSYYDAVQYYTEQARGLAGADYHHVETRDSTLEAEAAVEAIRQAIGDVHIVATFNHQGGKPDNKTNWGKSPAQTRDCAHQWKLLGYGANCGDNELFSGENGAQDLRQWEALCAALGPQNINGESGKAPYLFLKPNLGIAVLQDDGTDTHPFDTPDFIRRITRVAVIHGARAIGLCCGSTPESIATVRQMLTEIQSSGNLYERRT